MSDVPSLARTAASQYGLLNLKQRDDAGVSTAVTKYRRRTGHFQRIAPRVDAIAGTPTTWEQRVLAGCLSVDGLVAASHRTALRFHEVDQFDYPIELIVAYSRDPVPVGYDVHRSRDLLAEDITTIDSVPVTTIERTIVDVAAVISPGQLEIVIDKAVGRQLTTPRELRQMLDRVARKGRRGAGKLRLVLDERSLGDELTDSELEELFARVCRDHGVPMPECQVSIDLRGERRRLDFAYPDRKIVIEIDGYSTHTSWRSFQDDRARQNALIAAGWRVLRFTRHQLIRQPGLVAATLLRLL